MNIEFLRRITKKYNINEVINDINFDELKCYKLKFQETPGYLINGAGDFNSRYLGYVKFTFLRNEEQTKITLIISNYPIKETIVTKSMSKNDFLSNYKDFILDEINKNINQLIIENIKDGKINDR